MDYKHKTKSGDGSLQQPKAGSTTGKISTDKNNGPGSNLLLNKKAEEYLREGGKIEDYPSAADQQKADEKLSNDKQ